MAAVTVLRVIFELKKIRSATVSTFPPSICHEVMGPDAMTLVFLMLSSKPAFHSPLSLSSRGSLFPLHFLPLEWYYLHIWGYWYFSQQSCFQLLIHLTWDFTWCSWQESYDKPRQYAEKQRHYSANKSPYNQGYGLPSGHLWLWELGIVKKAEHQRIGAFKLWYWRRLLKIPWRARTSNQSMLRKINPEYSFKGLMLKLKLQYFDHLVWTVRLTGKVPDAGKDWGQRKRGYQRTKFLDAITDTMDKNSGKFWAMVRDREAWHDSTWVSKSWIWLDDWMTATRIK